MNSGIFNITKELFYDKGYSKTKISDITGKLGIVPGNFYRYYHSKEEILKKIVVSESRDYISKLREVNTKENFHEKLKLLLEVNLKLIFEKPHFFNLLLEVGSSGYKLEKGTLKAVNSISDITRNSIEEVLRNSTLDPFTKKTATEIIIKDLRVYLENLIKDSQGNNCPERILTLNYSEEFSHLFTFIKSICYGLGISNSVFSKIDPITKTYRREHFLDILSKSYDFLGCAEDTMELIHMSIAGISQEEENFFSQSILKDIGAFLKNAFRKNDKVGRIGYSTFLIFFTDYNSSLYKHIIDRFLQLEEMLKKKYSKVERIKVEFHHITIGGGENINFKNLFSSKDSFKEYCRKKI
ncbi:TetR family transcriptional regulator [Propionigenium maris]|nr:TetR family transcriptional regulator [Propionigenium maris]